MTGAQRSVVVVDDAAEVRVLARTQLRMAGRFVVVAEGSNGVEAIKLCEEHQPDLVLLDVSMPEVDGLEALVRIREVSPRTRVVMFTGFDEAGLGERARELGAAALIEKSSGITRLAEQLADVFDDAAAAREPAESAERDIDSQVLEDHLERFREVFEEAAIGMATMTLTGRVVRANKALGDLVGRSPGKLVGTPYIDLAPERDGDTISEALRQAQQGSGEVVQFEHAPRASAGPRRLLATAAPVRDARGHPLYLFLQCQDVTAQREAEEQLRQSEHRFRLLVEAVQDYAIFMLDPDGYVISWNAGAQRINGYSSDEIIGHHFRAFYPDEARAINHPEYELEVAKARGQYMEEGWRIRKDGSRFWSSVVITAVHDQSGRLIGFAKVTRDMSEHRQVLLNAEQEAADRAQFLAVTAHELRSPIGVLAGSAGLLVDHLSELTDSERAELIESISSSAARLQRLLRDLLTAARLEAGAVQLKWRDIEVAGLLGGTVAAARAAQPDAEIELEAPAGLYVRGEADRIAQAVDNLISNALRHGAAPVLVRARAVGDYVELVVSDNGPGVPEEMEERLFGRFASGSSGTGLGLYIVRELARAHGGDARYSRDEAGRPSFAIVLPAAGATPGTDDSPMP